MSNDAAIHVGTKHILIDPVETDREPMGRWTVRVGPLTRTLMLEVVRWFIDRSSAPANYEFPAMAAFEVSGAYITLIHNAEERAHTNRNRIAGLLRLYILEETGLSVLPEGETE